MKRRNTIQKELVLDAVTQMHRHVTADEVYDFIKCKHPTIGKGTVYRNLGILADEKLISRIEIPNGADRFEAIMKKHYHVRCIKCGQLYDVDMDEVKGIDSLIHDKHGIIFLDYDIIFKGICPECQKKENHPGGVMKKME